MTWLLDTCVLSELHKSDVNTAVKAYVDRIEETKLFISVITIGEIQRGIEKLEHGKKRSYFEDWLSKVESDFRERVLPVDAPTAKAWGQQSGRCLRRGIVIPAADGLIAATAIRHNCVLLTRNTRHMEHTGVMLRNPWEE